MIRYYIICHITILITDENIKNKISDGPIKWDLLDLFNIKKLPYETGIKAAKSNYCSKVFSFSYSEDLFEIVKMI